MTKRASQFYPELGKDVIYDGQSLIITSELLAASVDKHVFIAPFDCRVVSVREIHSVVGSTSAAVRLRKITDTSAPGAAASTTVKEITTAAFDLTATINTTQTGTLVAAATNSKTSDYYLAAGDKLALDFSGTLTGLVGLLSIHIKRT